MIWLNHHMTWKINKGKHGLLMTFLLKNFKTIFRQISMHKKESHIIKAAKKDDFDIEKLKVAWSKANSEKFE